MTEPWIVPVEPGRSIFPPYRAVSHGRWRIRIAELMADIGFWGDEGEPRSVAFLEGPTAQGDAPGGWMSTSRLEIESQEIGIAGAVGTTVVLGLGLGWAALNAALRPEVGRVVVVERDRDTIGLAEVSGLFDGVDPAVCAKIEFHACDAFAYAPDGPVDTLLADIWPDWQEPRVMRDASAINERVGAARVHVWGQEIFLWRHAVARNGPATPFDWPAIRRAVTEDIRLPLILPDWPDYPERILRCLRRCAPGELAAAGVSLSR